MKTANNRLVLTLVTALAVGLGIAGDAQAGPLTGAAREVLEWFMKKAPRELAKEGTEETAKRLGKLLAKHGDEAAPLLKELGPRGLRLVEKHGDEGFQIAQRLRGPGLALLESHGDAAVGMFRRYGGDGAELLARHPGIGQNLAGAYGPAAVGSLAKLESTSAIRLGKLADDFPRLPPAAQQTFLEKLAQGGDDFVAWVWHRKVEIFGSAAAAGVVLNFYRLGDGVAKKVPAMIPTVAAPPDPQQHPWLALLDRWGMIAMLGLIGGGIMAAGVVLWRRPRSAGA